MASLKPQTADPSPGGRAGRGRVTRRRQNLNIMGWNSQARREFPGKFESANLDKDNISREIVRSVGCAQC